MIIYRANIHIVQRGHHLLCQPYILILVAHLNTVLLVADRSDIGQIFRCAGTDVQTTLQTYVHDTEKMAEQSVDLFEKITQAKTS